MKRMNFNKGGKIGLLMLMVAAVLCVTASASFAVTDQTWLKTAAGGQVAAAGNCRFIAVAKSDDSYIMTEDDGGANYADSNGAYMAAGTTGFAKTDSTHWSTGWIVATDAYAIWVSSIADGQTGTASGTIGTVSPNYTTPGTNASQLSLGTTNYMATPANFKAYTGNGNVLLKWDAVTGATKYRIFRGPITGNSNSLYARMGTTTGLCYNDTSLTNGTKYYYIVVPMNGSNWYGVHTNQIPATPDATTAPTITSLSSTSLTVGSPVTITGTNFGATQGTGFVEFNGVVATTYTWTSATSITVTVPAGVTAGNVCVVNSSNRVSNGFAYTMAGASSFTSITPSSGYQGDTLTGVAIVGANTHFTSATPTVTFSGTGVTGSNVVVTNDTHLTCTIAIAAAAAAGTRNVVVTTGSEVVTGTGAFTVNTPSFASITPNSGGQGANLTGVVIAGTGTHFTGTPTVTFSGTNITVSSIVVTDATHLTCNVAIAAAAITGARNVVVTTGSETVTGTSRFTVISGLPTVTGVSPATGASPNTGITLTGTNFNGVTAIMIGSTPITVYSVSSATSITGVSIPAGLAAGAYDIRVTNAVGQSAVNSPADRYTVTSSGGGGGGKIYEGAGGIMMAYPNPFNPNDKANPLKMLFNVTTGEAVDIYIFDTNGRVIYQDRDSQTHADRTVTWDGNTSFGEMVENGLYLIRVVKDGKLVAKGKILVIKK